MMEKLARFFQSSLGPLCHNLPGCYCESEVETELKEDEASHNGVHVHRERHSPIDAMLGSESWKRKTGRSIK
jgi:hypothetical protein